MQCAMGASCLYHARSSLASFPPSAASCMLAACRPARPGGSNASLCGRRAAHWHVYTVSAKGMDWAALCHRRFCATAASAPQVGCPSWSILAPLLRRGLAPTICPYCWAYAELLHEELLAASMGCAVPGLGSSTMGAAFCPMHRCVLFLLPLPGIGSCAHVSAASCAACACCSFLGVGPGLCKLVAPPQ